MLETTNITGIILAGGKSSRMGTDKGFIPWEGKSFITHSIDALQPFVQEILIVSDHLHYDDLDYKRVEDVFPESGPLSGVYSGLLKSENAINLVLSCDIPLITSEVVQELINAYKEGTNAVVCKVHSKVMPLVAMYHKNCTDVCEVLLKNDERRMMHLLEKLDRVTYVSLSEQQALQVQNINNKTDLNNIKNAR
jgi:molybdopterin-guanine dinucleotide biosynthesis protein A